MIPIGDDPPPRRTFPIVTLTLIAVNIVVFIYELSLSDRALTQLIMAAGVTPLEFRTGHDIGPPAPYGNIYLTLVTSMFLHGGWLHIGSNMLFLWIFGDNVEDRLGHLRYLLFYVLCGLAAGGAQIVANLDSQIPSVGASGAIAGVLAGYILLFPTATVRTLLFLGPFITMARIPAIIMIGFWFVTQVISGLGEISQAAAQTNPSGVAFWAHVGGFIVGLPLVLLLKRPVRPSAYSYR